MQIDFYAPNADIATIWLITTVIISLWGLHLDHKRRLEKRRRERLEKLKRGCMRCWY